MAFSSSITNDDDFAGIFANPFSLFGSDQLTNTIEQGGETLYVTGGGSIPSIVFMGFQLTFAVITVALISGALAERVKFSTWLVFTVVWTTVVYFPLSHMVWGWHHVRCRAGFASWIFGSEDGEAKVAPSTSPVAPWCISMPGSCPGSGRHHR